ncbi:hypothetical protein CHL78_007360 [Romboutsia weinsteinii]|uniref:YgiT-type zinc finger protein n=1 Tax=Romboutsia weinsteinii TaxID=2020949 RepID=A0A371J569_9FIRM|nr:hypothetical protein [Romboutsia weinsteinii]RDY27816.1 hypothetical protein CHL78_007360 [Romboutsia weinsteinii]
MLKCKDCKKWLTSTRTQLAVDSNNTVKKVINIPAKECHMCGKITINDSTMKRVNRYINECKEEVLDFQKYEDDESVASNELLL